MESFRFPAMRTGLTRKIDCGLDLYLTVNAMADGQPGEVFVKLGKQGSTVSGLMQAWAMTISAALQRGVRWDELREKYLDARFEPNTKEYASLVDAVARNVDEMAGELRRIADQRQGLMQSDGDAAP